MKVSQYADATRFMQEPTDEVVYSHVNSNAQFRADTICPTYKDRILVTCGFEVKDSTKPSNFCFSASSMS